MAPVVESLKKRYTGAWGKLNVVADSAIFTGFILGCVAFAPDQLPGGAEPDCPAGSTFTEMSFQSSFSNSEFNPETKARYLSNLEEKIQQQGLDFDVDTPLYSGCSKESNPLSLSNADAALAFTMEPGKTPSLRELCAVSTTNTQICSAELNQMEQVCINIELFIEVYDVQFGDNPDAADQAKKELQKLSDLVANDPVATNFDNLFVADCSSSTTTCTRS